MSRRHSKAILAIIDDDARQRQQLASYFRTACDIHEAEDRQTGLALLQQVKPDILVLDLNLPPSGTSREGLQILRYVRQQEWDTIVIVMCDDAQKDTALKVMEEGAYDYFVKPIDLQILEVILVRAVDKQQLERENRLLRQEFVRQRKFGDLVGESEAMKQVYDSIRRVADSPATVIIRGESGTGKELVAKAIHEQSSRREQPFLSVNCGALPETLIEAELFGYEKGAFTGATATKEGRFELAHPGTLFLDEIGSLSLSLQTKLLRVLEERAFVRLGGKKPIQVDIRLITATNENLEDMVAQGKFREDLYYRIHVVPIYIPPLRERTEDIPLLADYFLTLHCVANKLPLKRIEEPAMGALERYTWKGNVRELENTIQRLVLLTDGNVITVKNLPAHIAGFSRHFPADNFRLPPGGMKLPEEVTRFERRWLEAALAQASGVKAEAARLLGLDKDRMKYLCRKYRL